MGFLSNSVNSVLPEIDISLILYFLGGITLANTRKLLLTSLSHSAEGRRLSILAVNIDDIVASTIV